MATLREDLKDLGQTVVVIHPTEDLMGTRNHMKITSMCATF